MRIYYPNEEALQALKDSNIELIIDVVGEIIPTLAESGSASKWVNNFVIPYSYDVKIKYITVGNEIQPSDNEAQYILPVMQNIQNAISSANLQDQIKVSTAIDMTLLRTSYPPNNGAFSDDASPYIKPIISFLANNGAPLLANVYPDFAYVNDQQSIPLKYALFTQDGNNNVGYQILFDAMLDALYAALEKVGASDLQIVVSESGWPSEGGDGATIENASTYYKNLVNHANGGTPKRPNEPIEVYLFVMFDENQKSGAEIEYHFGLFNPNQSAKYDLKFD